MKYRNTYPKSKAVKGVVQKNINKRKAMQHQKLGGKSCVQLQLMALVNGGTQYLKADLLCTTYFVTLNSSSYTGPFFQVVPFLVFFIPTREQHNSSPNDFSAGPDDT